ncbi:GNAT family N-acetyltransferase [Nocardioides euryhalodurans]|uniref:GNAT family N-acetyltransferase n=1 Tax=Nocardioides euryhalodurans TaxID=2518370 RepID=UPI00142293B4|nr:GNAT family N-acetyltransferase [Nocardioides euryhalodurans]
MRFPDDVPTLTDGTVTLRAHAVPDLPRIVEQCRDPESIAWTTVPTPYDEQDARDWIGTVVPAGWEGDSTYCFAIEHDGCFAGSVDLRMKGGGEGELGFGLHPDARGDGLMRRALMLLLDWGFERHGLAVVQWRAFTGNWASRRTVWGLGFSFGPTVPQLLPHRGERRDAWTGWIGAADAREPVEPWLVPPVLEADGVRLRAWCETDGPGLVEAANDPTVRQWIPDSPLPREPGEVPGYLLRVHQAAATNARMAWCVADAESDAPLGNVALFEFEEDGDDLTAQVGYWSLPAGRGRGAMTTALRTATDWALRRRGDGGFGARRLYLLTSPRNLPSRALAERAGFTHVGTERGSGPLAGGGYEDSALYDRLRDAPEG